MAADLLEQLRVNLLIFRLRRAELARLTVKLVPVLVRQVCHDSLFRAMLVQFL